MVKLNKLEELPKGFLDVPVHEIASVLDGPSLIHLPGENPQPLFITTLLHGNETTGLQALQLLFKEYKQQQKLLPRSVILFIGNVEAAKRHVRKLPDQPDYNRIWDGGDSQEHKLVDYVINYVKSQNVFASLDIHNNTGWNPCYACINSVDPKILHLAKRFSRTMILFFRPPGCQSLTMSTICPAVTLESGLSGNHDGIVKVKEYIDECLHLKDIPDYSVGHDEVEIYRNHIRILVPLGTKVGFDDEDKDLDICFVSDLETYNFNLMPAGTLIGWQLNKDAVLHATDEARQDISDQVFTYKNGEIRTKEEIFPSMLTSNVKNIYQDCLGYFMQRVELEV